MTIKSGDWIGESTITTGTGPIVLAGAIPGFSSFSAFGDGQFYYTIIDGDNKETGLGTVSSGILTRTSISAIISNGVYVKNGAPISLSGVAQVYGTINSSVIDMFYNFDTRLTSAESDVSSLNAENIAGDGSGYGLFVQRLLNIFKFKKIKAGQNVTITSDANSITIHSSISGGSQQSGDFGGLYRNLKIIVNGSSGSYSGTITADRLVVEDSSFRTKVLQSLDVSFNCASNGVNGLDVGTISANTWYYIYIIYNEAMNTIASIVSLSDVAPTLPSGYGYFARIGSAYSLGSSFRGSTKNNNYVSWFYDSSSTMVNVVYNSYSVTMASFSIASAKPPKSNRVSVRMIFPTGSSGWAELDLHPSRNYPIIYINQTEQSFCADIPVLVPDTLYYFTSGPSAKIYVNIYGYFDDV